MPDVAHTVWPLLWGVLGLALCFLMAVAVCAVLLVRRAARLERDRSRAALEKLALEIARGNEAAGRAFVEAVVQEAKGVFANFDFVKFSLEEVGTSIDRLSAEVRHMSTDMRRMSELHDVLIRRIDAIGEERNAQGDVVAPLAVESGEAGERQTLSASDSEEIRQLRHELSKALPHLNKIASRSESLDQLLRSTARSLGKLKVSMF